MNKPLTPTQAALVAALTVAIAVMITLTSSNHPGIPLDQILNSPKITRCRRRKRQFNPSLDVDECVNFKL